MMLGLQGLSGVTTCDMVVNAAGNAVDCSSFWNIFQSACWNSLSPCAAPGSVNGQPAQVDNSQSQLGSTVASILESSPGAQAGQSS